MIDPISPHVTDAGNALLRPTRFLRQALWCRGAMVVYMGAASLMGGISHSLAESEPIRPVDSLLPHRAVYDLSLKSSSNRAGIDGVAGRIVYELTGSPCEGYASRYRFSTDVRMNGRMVNNDQRSTTFESGDGKRFDFLTQYYLNGQQEQDLRGSATLSEEGIKVSLKTPDERDVELGSAMFMNAHLGKIIEAARQGETVLAAKVFDGSDDGDKLVNTTAIIGKPRMSEGALPGEPKKVSKQFDGTLGWPVSVTYYNNAIPEGGGEELPGYQVSFTLYPDGVSRNLTMVYPDYALKGVLKQIDYLPINPCS